MTLDQFNESDKTIYGLTYPIIVNTILGELTVIDITWRGHVDNIIPCYITNKGGLLDVSNVIK